MTAPDLGIPGLAEARLIGRGGFGAVYAATEPEFGRTVAVKVLRERLDDEAVRRAFERECRAMGTVSGHPHIVTVHRGGTTASGAPYIVMDLMSGGSLADRVTRAPLAWPEVLDTGVLLASALETAHRNGILHLDLKPANVLVSRYGEPKLGDFGISRLPGIAETSSGIQASPAFAAPERLAGGSATVATDVYGLGATLFTLLTGTPAFQGEAADLIVVLARIVRQPVPDLRGQGVPDAACRVLERLMAKEPQDRYRSAADVAVALQDAQRATGRPITRAVVEGAPTPAQEAAAATSVTLEPVGAPPAPAPHAGSPRPVAAQHRPDGAAPWPAPAPAGAADPRWPGSSPADPRWRAAPPADPARPPAASGWTHRTDPPPAPPDRPRRHTLLLVLGAAAVVLAIGLGVVLALRATGAGPDPDVAAGPSPIASPAPPAVTPTPAAPTPVPTSPPGAVTVASGVDDPNTDGARQVLDDYVTAINEERYAEAFALFSPDSATARDGLPAWLEAQRPRAISDARLVSVRTDAPDELTAVLTFRSRQDPAFSPDGTQSCLDWELSYALAGPARQIRSSSLVTDPRPC